MSLFNSLLVHLSDGKPHLLSDLASQMGLDEPALSRMLAQYQSDGLNVEQDEFTRWRDPQIPLQASAILREMHIDSGCDFDIEYQVDSTNQQLRNDFCHRKACLAERQSQGRGRRGRSWFSPPAVNIYLSLGWCFKLPVAQLSGLSLAVGMKLVDALQPHTRGALSVKWPNDVYLNNRKLAGILIESVPRGSSETEIIIGIGVNVSMQSAQPVDQPWVCMGENHVKLDRNLLVAAILDQLLQFLPENTATSAAVINSYVQQHWHRYDGLKDRVVSVSLGERQISGIGAGIDDQFNFLLETSAGRQVFCSGDVSLRLGEGTAV